MEKEKSIKEMSLDERKKIVEEQEKNREELLKVRQKTLENTLYLFGANVLKGNSNPLGTAGSSAEKMGYSAFISSDYARELRKELNNNKQQEYAQSGFNYTPTISDIELAKHAYDLGQEILASSDANDLEKLVSSVVKDLKIENKTLVEEEIKFKKKIKENFINSGEQYKPSKEEGEILQYVQAYKSKLIEVYEKAAAKMLVDMNYYNDDKMFFEELNKKFPEKKQEKEPEKIEK